MGESIKTSNTAARWPRKGMSMDAEKAKSKSVLREEELEEFNLRHKLPELRGTEKQVPYANRVRKMLLNRFLAKNLDITSVKNAVESKFWLDGQYLKTIDWEQMCARDQELTEHLPIILVKDSQNTRIRLSRSECIGILVRNQFTKETLSCCEEIEITATFKITRIKQIGENKAANKEIPEKPN